jgi:hypothetical protein
MKTAGRQGELFGILWQPKTHPFRLRVNDLIRVDGRIGLIVRVSECAAVVLMNQQARVFRTRFDKLVKFRPAPQTFRISSNAEVEIIHCNVSGRKKSRASVLDHTDVDRQGRRTA